jgi:uncharacterized protein (TIGR00290 family)
VKRRALLSWSSGKDSAWALHRLRQEGTFELAGLVTTLNEPAGRVAMHAVRESLLERQAAAAGLPLRRVPIPSPCSDAAYEAAMTQLVTQALDDGIEVMAFGDLFLEDVRAYRERQLAGTGLEPCFPIWGLETAALAREMVASGLRARVTCVDPRRLAPAFAGRHFDSDFLDALPEGVDPCGENGEFHTFACAGPMFAAPILVEPGPVVARDGFVFADLLPAAV